MLQIHVILSLIGIVAGLVVLYELIFGRPSGGVDRGLSHHDDPHQPHRLPAGALRLRPAARGRRAVAGAARLRRRAYYAFHLAGIWRVIYVGTAMAALYLNVFVLVAQGFLKVPFLHDLAPTGSEPPFAVAQGIVLLIFIALGVWAARRFHPEVAARA